MCVRVLLHHMCVHTSAYVSAYCCAFYVCFHIYPHTALSVSVPPHTVVYVLCLHTAQCVHTTALCVSSYYYICVLIPLYFCCMCVLILLCFYCMRVSLFPHTNISGLRYQQNVNLAHPRVLQVAKKYDRAASGTIAVSDVLAAIRRVC